MITVHLNFLISLNKSSFQCLIEFVNPIYRNLIILIMIPIIAAKF